MMELVSRSKNVISQSKDLEVLHSLNSFPVFMGCVEHDESKDLHADISWAISPNNGILQLISLIPINILYQSQHHAPRSVLEIGGAHGILSREYKKLNKIDWTILEPNPSPAEGVSAEFIEGFFDDNFTFDGEFDTIIHSHVFEHVYYPDEFIIHISGFLENGQNLIFSLPNMEQMLKRKYTNCINFEHTVFITEPYVEHLLSKHGFRQISKEYFKEDHSIFYAYVKDSSTPLVELPKGLYEHNKILYLDYVDYHNKLISDLNVKIDKTSNDRPIYLFGAHVFAQYLIEFGLNIDRIVCLLDNDIKKQGKRLYGTSMIVESPKMLAGIDNPIVILKAGFYNKEVRDDILDNINSGTIFWE